MHGKRKKNQHKFVSFVDKEVIGMSKGFPMAQGPEN